MKLFLKISLFLLLSLALSSLLAAQSAEEVANSLLNRDEQQQINKDQLSAVPLTDLPSSSPPLLPVDAQNAADESQKATEESNEQQTSNTPESAADEQVGAGEKEQQQLLEASIQGEAVGEQQVVVEEEEKKEPISAAHLERLVKEDEEAKEKEKEEEEEEETQHLNGIKDEAQLVGEGTEEAADKTASPPPTPSSPSSPSSSSPSSSSPSSIELPFVSPLGKDGKPPLHRERGPISNRKANPLGHEGHSPSAGHGHSPAPFSLPLSEEEKETRLDNAHKAGPGHEKHMDRIRAHQHQNGQVHVVRDDPHREIRHGSHSHTLEEAEERSSFIVLSFLGFVVAAQVLILLWKKFYRPSYELVSLVGLWIIPFIWSLYDGFYRMLLLWIFYSCAMLFVMSRALRSPVQRDTPRLFYQFFSLVYKSCYLLAVGGYSLIMLELFGLSFALPAFLERSFSALGLLLLFYGLYFGLLSRDLCQLCSQRMAVNIGYIAAKGEMPSRQLPTNQCAICDHPLFGSVRLSDKSSTEDEKVHKLSCGHSFHDRCIRGWTIIGKRDTCAYCNEKVRLREVFTNPWESQSLLWGLLLDVLRYIIVFNPVILLSSQAFLEFIW